MRGPFGSAFSRCFEMVPRPQQISAPRFHCVVLIGTGVGLPSALSALREYCRRRMAGVLVPPFVWFLWQCRNAEDLSLAWDSLHRLIFQSSGLCTEEEDSLRSMGREATRDAGLSYRRHEQRFGEPWTEASAMLDWLGLTLYVSRWKENVRRCLNPAEVVERGCPSARAAPSQHTPPENASRMRVQKGSTSERSAMAKRSSQVRPAPPLA